MFFFVLFCFELGFFDADLFCFVLFLFVFFGGNGGLWFFFFFACFVFGEVGGGRGAGWGGGVQSRLSITPEKSITPRCTVSACKN